ncbi:5-dehydro-2-deoxygluconokinase [Bacillus sp. NP157]|nr:5-dehydro-2-deoxygluconokinase [Bacillus sp. NP157]
MRSPLPRSTSRPIDVACLGRLAVDLYAQQIGARLEDVTSFAKYLGGSSANVAFGTARLGLQSAMLSRVGDDQMGTFLLETLANEGSDVSQVKVDPERLTALAILGIKDSTTFPLLFYRENCADMALDAADIDEAFIGRCRALAITGTHLSQPGVRAASQRALELARSHDVRTVLDIDYRPVLWGLTGRGNGAQRFVAAEHVTRDLQAMLPLFDLIVGTEEEFHIAGGSEDLLAALRAVRGITAATLVVKRGPLGCTVIDGPIPGDIDHAPTYRGARVEVLNVLGAGDAFLSGFLAGWLRDESIERACAWANACGAIVVSRHACAPAMPARAELDAFLGREGGIARPDLDAELSHLHRAAIPRKAWNELYVFAFDHRTPFFELVREAGGDEARLPRLKELLVEAVAATERANGLQGHVGLLADDRYGQDALNAATGRSWWIGRPVEVPGSNPLEFERGRSIGSQLVSWPREHVIKCLVQFDPDAEPLHRVEQETQLLALYDAAKLSGHELLLEVIPPGCTSHAQRDELVLRSMKRIYNLGIQPDWWKLCPPRREAWPAIDALIHERDPFCRGVLLLGLNAPAESLAAGFADATGSSTVRGFAVGRTLFAEPSKAWLAGRIDDATLVDQARTAFEAMIRAWQQGTQRQPESRVAEGAAA